MLYRRPNSNNYWCRFTAPNGKEVRRTTKTTNKKAAQEFEAKLKSEFWRVQHLGSKQRRSWQEATIRWLQETAHKKTHEDDKAALRFAHPYLGSKMLDEINRSLLDSLLHAKAATGVSNATVNRLMEVIRAILNRAEKEWEWLDKAPAVRMLTEPKRRIRWLTPDEVKRLLSEVSGHLKAMVQFSLLTGLREANVTGLEWSQVDLDRRVAWIHPDQAKAGKAIGVALNDDAVELLKQLKELNATRVFTYKGRPVKKANTKAWREALKRVGIENFRWHDLRHTWASWHVQAGTSIHVLQELGGWSDIRMVQKYAHLAPENLSQDANNISLPK